MNSNKEINEKIYPDLQSLEEVYQEILIEGDHEKEAHLLLELRDWLIDISDYDPRSGRPLPLSISQITNNTVEYLSAIDRGPLKDR